MTTTTDYSAKVISDAHGTTREFLDQIIDNLMGDDDASSDLYNDYPNGDGYHHGSHVDREYDLQEAAAVLSQLSEHEETDSGLWESLDPRKAISAQAAFTYGNAVLSEWSRIIEAINNDDDILALRNMATHLDDFSSESLADKMRAAIKAAMGEALSPYTT